MLFKIVSYTSKELKNRTVLSFQNIICVAMWSYVMYSNCFECNLLKEQMVINLSAMLLLKVRLCLILFITVLLNYKYMV